MTDQDKTEDQTEITDTRDTEAIAAVPGADFIAPTGEGEAAAKTHAQADIYAADEAKVAEFNRARRAAENTEDDHQSSGVGDDPPYSPQIPAHLISKALRCDPRTEQLLPFDWKRHERGSIESKITHRFYGFAVQILHATANTAADSSALDHLEDCLDAVLAEVWQGSRN